MIHLITWDLKNTHHADQIRTHELWLSSSSYALNSTDKLFFVKSNQCKLSPYQSCKKMTYEISKGRLCMIEFHRLKIAIILWALLSLSLHSVKFLKF